MNSPDFFRQSAVTSKYGAGHLKESKALSNSMQNKLSARTIQPTGYKKPIVELGEKGHMLPAYAVLHHI